MNDREAVAEDVRIVLAAVVSKICNCNCLLLSRRKAGDRFAGFWELPGGKVEKDESPEVALTRELREELGIGIAVGSHLATFRDRAEGRTFTFDLYRCAHVQGEVRHLQVDDHAWADAHALTQYAFPPANAAVLPVLDALLRTPDS